MACIFAFDIVNPNQNSLIILKILLKGYENRIFPNTRQAFTMTNNMASSGLWETVLPTNIILTTDATIGYAKINTV